MHINSSFLPKKFLVYFISVDFETLNNWTTFQSTVTVSFCSLPMTTPNAFRNPLKGLSQQ